MKDIIDFFEKIALPFLNEWGNLVLAFLAFIISLISLRSSSKAQKLQNRINKLELLIKQNEAEKIEIEKKNANHASIGARIIPIGLNKYQLKVSNSGEAIAYNVIARFDGNPYIYIIDKGKQPFDELHPRENYTLPLVVPDGAATKVKIITEWTDASGQTQIKTHMTDL